MATTFLQYERQLVQVPESIVTITGYMLFYEAYLTASTPEDKSRFEQMTRDFGTRTIGTGCTDLGLDELLQGDPEKEKEFLTFVHLARKRISGFGGTIPAEYVDRFIPIPEYKGMSCPSAWYHKMLNVIEALIRGEPVSPVMEGGYAGYIDDTEKPKRG